MGLLGVIWKRRPQACLPEMVRILKKVPVWMTERVKIAEMFLSSWIDPPRLIPTPGRDTDCQLSLHAPFPKTQTWDQGLPGSGLGGTARYGERRLVGAGGAGGRRRGLGIGGKRGHREIETLMGDLGWGISGGHLSESLNVFSSLCSYPAASKAVGPEMDRS